MMMLQIKWFINQCVILGKSNLQYIIIISKMKRIKYFILVITFLLFCVTSYAEQLDSRHRSIETIIADGLAQLPTKDVKTYNQVIGEIANTGFEGIQMLSSMLVPADKGENAKFEYAINSTVNYAMIPGNENLRTGIRKGLIAGLDKCTDNANKAFLMTELQKCATSADFSVFEKYLDDSYLKNFAVRGLATIPGINDKIISLMKSKKITSVDFADMSYLVYFRKIKEPDVEKLLLKWLNGADKKTTSSIYNALTIFDTSESIAVLGSAAKKNDFDNDLSGATDCYLQVLDKAKATKTVIKAANELMKNDKIAVRCAGLTLLLKKCGNKAPKVILQTLKNKNKEYRNTALLLAKESAGEGIFDIVAKKSHVFSPETQTDIIRWLGNNHVASQIDVIDKAMNSKNAELVTAAIYSAGQIGGDKALKSLIAMLESSYAKEASNALLSFHGNINEGVLKALDTNIPATQIQALTLASKRHMFDAYERVLKLTNSSIDSVKNAAYDALSGVTEESKFNEVCDLLEKSKKPYIEKLQNAAKCAIANDGADKQFKIILSRLDATNNATKYYPLLAQAGNEDAINKLMGEYGKMKTKKEAFKSLLEVDNPAMIDILLKLASENASSKDKILTRYLTLVNSSNVTNVSKYLYYRAALDLKPSIKVQNNLINALGNTLVYPALFVAANYLDSSENASAAAIAIKTIIAKNKDNQKGEIVKTLLNKAKSIFVAQKEKGDADAGYSVDEITDLMPKIINKGYEEIFTGGDVTVKKAISSSKKYENFELMFDWKCKDGAKGILELRSMPQVILTCSGASIAKNERNCETCKNDCNKWNSLYIKVVNDRIMIILNGEKIIENETIVNTPISKAINTNGFIKLFAQNGIIEVRDMYVNELPATPFYTLSTEEKKAGFELLFDGRSLEKWQGNTTGYVPEDGNIYVTANYGGSGNLYTKKKYSDFIYRFEFSFAVPGVNNGIGIRTKIGADAAYDGMEIQILDHDDPIYKGLHDYQQHGAVYGIIVPKHVKFGSLGTWNKEEIRAIGDHITVIVNGEVILDGNIRTACKGHNVVPDDSLINPYTIDKKNHPGLFNKDGYISFCGHGAGIKFRNVRILDLSKQNKKK